MITYSIQHGGEVIYDLIAALGASILLLAKLKVHAERFLSFIMPQIGNITSRGIPCRVSRLGGDNAPWRATPPLSYIVTFLLPSSFY
jgi:hypothetical protein